MERFVWLVIGLIMGSLFVCSGLLLGLTPLAFVATFIVLLIGVRVGMRFCRHFVVIAVIAVGGMTLIILPSILGDSLPPICNVAVLTGILGMLVGVALPPIFDE